MFLFPGVFFFSKKWFCVLFSAGGFVCFCFARDFVFFFCKRFCVFFLVEGFFKGFFFQVMACSHFKWSCFLFKGFFFLKGWFLSRVSFFKGVSFLVTGFFSVFFRQSFSFKCFFKGRIFSRIFQGLFVKKNLISKRGRISKKNKTFLTEVSGQCLLEKKNFSQKFFFPRGLLVFFFSMFSDFVIFSKIFFAKVFFSRFFSKGFFFFIGKVFCFFFFSNGFVWVCFDEGKQVCDRQRNN